MPPRIALRDIALFERPVAFVRPFRFGAVVVNAAPQAFVRVELDVEGKGVFVGASAEMMVPKWFDKRPHLRTDDTVQELRRALTIARDLYRAQSGLITAFGLHAACIAPQVAACAREDIPPLAAAFGPAEIDKAILDALLRGLGLNFFDGMAANVAGLDARLAPDLGNDDITGFLAARRRLPRVAVRHTVGLDDAIEGEGGVADVTENGARYFKLKMNGDPEADARRLIRIGEALATLPHDYQVTLDANEQYADLAALASLVDRLDRDRALAPIASKLLYIEQPMPRDTTRHAPLGALAARRDFIIDEADDSWDAFPAAKALGYRGISSKSCKGLYKSIVNATRAASWSAGGENFFITGEDLTCQAGLGVQQDLALGALIGVTHAERNGHHYVDGFGTAPQAEAEAFLAAHPDLYARGDRGIHLSIHDGDLVTGSLASPGFASGAHPDWTALAPLQASEPTILQEHSL